MNDWFLCRLRMPAALVVLVLFAGVSGTVSAATLDGKKKAAAKDASVMAVAQRYAEALASGDRLTAGRLDFACQYGLVSASAKAVKAFPPESDPLYARCWDALSKAHETAVQRRDEGLNALWPGKGSLIFFAEELTEYAPSFFVMDRLGLSPPAGGLRLELVNTRPLPAASFRLSANDPLKSAPAALAMVRVVYKDPLTSPVTYAPSEYIKTRNVRSVRQPLKAATVRWVVLSGLRRFGFPGDMAVLNLPVMGADGPIPFVTETCGYVTDSGIWWGPADASGVLTAAVGRAVLLPEHVDRIALLNRVLIVDPFQAEALTALSRELFQTLLSFASNTHKMSLGDAALAARYNQLYWDIYAETARMDISFGREMIGLGGVPMPTPADYLYRMLPAMEKLAQLRPQDLENRLRLGTAYRWNNDQLTAIATHEGVVKELPPGHPLRARALTELAWSRIAKVAWNRTFDDPGILEAYKEAQEAYKITERPLDKFTGAYTMAYSLAFTPNRDNHAMLELLSDARRWYMQIPGAKPESWRYLLENDTLKGVIHADPAFNPLLAALVGTGTGTIRK